MYPGVGDNPWIGTKTVTLKLIRNVIEGVPVSYDGLRPEETYQITEREVSEGYRARYLGGERGQIDVWALRFRDPTYTDRATLKRLAGEVPRIILGDIAVHVDKSAPITRGPIADSVDACYRAVRAYIESLK